MCYLIGRANLKIVCSLIAVLYLVNIFELNANERASTQDQSVAEQLYQNLDVAMPELSQFGRFAVGVVTKEIEGPNLLRKPDGRKLTLEIWYPASVSTQSLATYKDVTRGKQRFTLQGRARRNVPPLAKQRSFPLVILSHGYTGYRTMMFHLGEHLASHGYVVASIDHTDSTNREIDFVNAAGAGFQSTLLHRSLDQQTVQEYIAGNESQFSADTKNSSIIGFSMGGFGALNTAGGCYNFSEAAAKLFGFDPTTQTDILTQLNACRVENKRTESKWKAMVAIAPWGGEAGVITGLDQIKVPSLYIAGDQDDVSGFEKGVRSLYQQTGAKDKYLMVYENARHNLAAHPAPAIAHKDELSLGHYFEPAWNTETINHINNHMILAFLNCHVKGSESACKYLPKRESITQVKQADGTLTSPWPGFKNRFGTGIRFYRSN